MKIKNIWKKLKQKLVPKIDYVPFSFLFKMSLSPEALYYLISSERNQTIAFILSFCKKKKYINGFFNLLDKNEMKSLKLYIIEYLNNCPAIISHPTDYAEIAREIERVLEKKLSTISSEVVKRKKMQLKMK